MLVRGVLWSWIKEWWREVSIGAGEKGVLEQERREYWSRRKGSIGAGEKEVLD